ncbi:short-chain dehydrogenase/reductase SDR [Hymenobacter roseosalivarius DSM 11622]|uniref:Short-chain dehydrogenase/reductase SDR n=1 Tax=Hymenobacter roseosalivarius DSM 11622 TaxID=645990 RepID=A0A1W1VZK5_9BACT|nr:SDR family NAD(P)-dependent oxidoreductase [Hymenobacter roseosalivarius]SMB98778.1 short-chain dehydrogenase/reductase SDR [Hymenobacter roseosalivarius DSM 11622]
MTASSESASSPLRGKIALVTGASGGIGLITARELARRGARVVMVCRNPERGEQARTAIREAVGSDAQLDLLLCDLSLLANVRTLAGEVTRRFNQLDILVNNAGIFPGPLTITEEGHELSWATNHLAVFALTNLLLPQLLAAPQARIVTVSSEAHWLGEIEQSTEARNAPEKYSSFTAYCDSKLANIMFTSELAHRLDLTKVTANCLHPGMVDTGLVNTGSSPLMKAMWWTARPFMISPEKGARTSIYLASSPEVESVSGKYFKNRKPTRASGRSQSRPEAARLWRLSQEETGVE